MLTLSTGVAMVMAANALSSFPAQGQVAERPARSAVLIAEPGVRIHRGDRDGRRHDRDRHRRDRRGDVSMIYYGGEWALHNNRGWEADSYNDWWHERPERSLPRWTRTSRDCERQWWSGGGWTC